MTSLKLILKIFLFSILSVAIFAQRFFSNLSQSDIIAPGHGYSSDKQQISPIACYQVKVLPITHSSGIIHFDSGVSFNELQKALRVDVQARTKIGMFSSSLGVNYVKSAQDTDYSFSINYYSYIEAEIAMEVGFGPAAVLTADGMRAYQDGTNPDFGLICGDQFIDSYKSGATLIMGLKVEFQSSTSKEAFMFHMQGSFGSFGSISTDLQKTAQKYSISGKVTIEAYQIGGNPSQLAKILNKDEKGNYYAAMCSLNDMISCQKAVNGLLDYATQSFTTQVSVVDNKGLSSFPIGFASLVDVRWLGLTIPPSWVNYAVEQARTKLGDAFYENKYYIEKFYVLLNKYPIPWNKANTLYKNALKLSNAVNANMDLLMDTSTGAITCYSDVKNCVENSKNILSSLTSLDEQSLVFLNEMKYCVNMECGAFYKNGDTKTSWFPRGDCLLSLYTVSIDQQQYCYDMLINDFRNATCHLKSVGCLNFDSLRSIYLGSRDNWWVLNGIESHQIDFVTNERKISQYYFEQYVGKVNQEIVVL